MPNHCNNYVTFTFDTESEAKELADWMAKEDNGFCEYFRPMPKELEGTTAPSPEGQPIVDGVDNWYDWRNRYWGTKWGDYDQDVTLDGETVQIIFQSAWSPPIELYNYVCENLDVAVYASYEEMGSDFAGTYEDGVDDCMPDLTDAYVGATGDEYPDEDDYPDDDYSYDDACMEWEDNKYNWVQEELGL